MQPIEVSATFFSLVESLNNANFELHVTRPSVGEEQEVGALELGF